MDIKQVLRSKLRRGSVRIWQMSVTMINCRAYSQQIFNFIKNLPKREMKV